MGDSIKLLSFWASPYAMRARLALKLKGLDYELQEESLRDKSELLLRSNPIHQKVPVLLHNGKAICESMLIVQYIDEVWAEDGTRPGFIPRDPFARATTRFWADFVEKMFFSRDSAGYRVLRSSGAEKEKAEEELLQNWMKLEGLLDKDDGPFFGGKSMGYVDIALCSFPWNNPVLTQCGLNVPAADVCPRLNEWMEAMRSSPHAAAVFPDQQALSDYMTPFLKASAANKS